MKIKTSKGLKVVIIAVALLLCLALAIGITGAFYQAKRQATGTLSMDQGIIIDYNGFDKTAAEDWATWTRGVTLPLFKTNDAQPGQNIPVNAAGIRANAESVNFYARVKLSYKFYNGETPVELADATKLIKTSSSFFGTNWVESGDGYYYYATGSTLNKFAKTATTFVDLFATDAKFVIEGAGFTGADNNGEGGGFVDGTTSINKIEVYLTLETLQGDATAEQAKALGWEITTGGTEGENVVELTPEDYTSTTTTDDETGEEKTIYTPSETFVGKNPKYAFTFSLNDTDKTATITGPVGSPTELDIPSKLIVKGQDYTTTSIGIGAFAECSSLTSIKISDSVTSIGAGAFVMSGLTSIKIPASVTSIGIGAFYNCSSLTSITIGNSVKSIGNYAFAECSSLTSVTIPNSITSIGAGAFVECSSLTSVTIGNGVKSIGESAFSGCSSLTSVTIPDSVESIGENAFVSCTGLTSVTIPDSVTSIGGNAFYDCEKLQPSTTEGNIAYLGNESNLYLVAWKVTDKNQTSYSIKDGCKIIYQVLFADCSSTTSINIPNSVTSIGEYAFLNCSGLTSIIIPNSVTSIGDHAFYDCDSLTTVTIGNGVTTIGDYAFRSCRGLTSIEIPASVTSIGEYAFQLCSGLTSITIPNSVTSIGNYAFDYCRSLEEIKVAEGNANYHSAGNCLIETASKTLILGCKTSIIPTDGSVTSIGSGAFSGCSGLTSITIPNSVTSIGKYAFSGCIGLTSITIPDSVTSIGESAFYYCDSLTSITIPASVTSIGEYAFGGCSGLEEIKVAEGNASYHSAGNCLIETASKTLILGCKNSEIPTDGSVTSIGDYAFFNCSGLTSITIPDSVTSIGYSAFGGCSSLTSVTIDSATIEGLGSSNSKLLWNATTVYVKDGLTVGTYITNSFTKAASSDKVGYDMYTKKA